MFQFSGQRYVPGLLLFSERRGPRHYKLSLIPEGTHPMSHLIHRPRRLRSSEALRSLVREARLAREDFILPLFACPGQGIRREVSSMPGVHNLSVDEIAKEAANACELGVRGVILFGLPEAKDELASAAYAETGIVQQAVRAIRRSAPDLIIITD